MRGIDARSEEYRFVTKVILNAPARPIKSKLALESSTMIQNTPPCGAGSYKFLFRRADLATLATKSVKSRHWRRRSFNRGKERAVTAYAVMAIRPTSSPAAGTIWCACTLNESAALRPAAGRHRGRREVRLDQERQAASHSAHAPCRRKAHDHLPDSRVECRGVHHINDCQPCWAVLAGDRRSAGARRCQARGERRGRTFGAGKSRCQIAPPADTELNRGCGRQAPRGSCPSDQGGDGPRTRSGSGRRSGGLPASAGTSASRNRPVTEWASPSSGARIRRRSD